MRHAADDVVEQFFFPAQLLRLLGVAPDVRVLEFARDLGQAMCFGIDVKDTSAARQRER